MQVNSVEKTNVKFTARPLNINKTKAVTTAVEEGAKFTIGAISSYINNTPVVEEWISAKIIIDYATLAIGFIKSVEKPGFSFLIKDMCEHPLNTFTLMYKGIKKGVEKAFK